MCPCEVYDNLVATVRKHMPAMHRYVRLRKKMLGVDELHFYDVYAPLVGDLKKSYTYETAQQMVLKAVAPLGEDYQKDCAARPTLSAGSTFIPTAASAAALTPAAAMTPTPISC